MSGWSSQIPADGEMQADGRTESAGHMPFYGAPVRPPYPYYGGQWNSAFPIGGVPPWTQMGYPYFGFPPPSYYPYAPYPNHRMTPQQVVLTHTQPIRSSSEPDGRTQESGATTADTRTMVTRSRSGLTAGRTDSSAPTQQPQPPPVLIDIEEEERQEPVIITQSETVALPNETQEEPQENTGATDLLPTFPMPPVIPREVIIDLTDSPMPQTPRHSNADGGQNSGSSAHGDNHNQQTTSAASSSSSCERPSDTTTTPYPLLTSVSKRRREQAQKLKEKERQNVVLAEQVDLLKRQLAESKETAKRQQTPDKIQPQLEPSAENVASPSSTAKVSCPICLDGYNVVVKSGRGMQSTRCGHVCCSVCMTAVLKANPPLCPQCRQRLAADQVFPIYL